MNNTNMTSLFTTSRFRQFLLTHSPAFISGLALFFGCASQVKLMSSEPSMDALSTKLKSAPLFSVSTQKPSDDGSKLFMMAQRFDGLIQGTLNKQDEDRLLKSCRKPSSKNPFCHSLSHSKILKYRIRASRQIRKAPVKTEPSPVPPNISGERITNWRELRRTELEPLLEGLKPLDLNTLMILGRRSLEERYCPNHIAIATAATLEEYLPDKIKPKDIADLYMKSSQCFRKNPANFEHFLIRAALLYFWSGDYSSAERVLKQINPTDALVGRTTYWLFRTQLKLGKANDAQRSFENLFARHTLSFHTLMAAISMNQNLDEPFFHPPTDPQKRSKKSPSFNRFLNQIEILTKYGFVTSAHFLAEWTHERHQKVEPEVRLYLASLGSDTLKVTSLPFLFIMHPRLISPVSMKLSFPTPHMDIFKENNFGLDPLLLLSIGRKESEFQVKAVSHADARGLLQIHPDRAQQLAPQMELDLFNPSVNISLGAFHLRQLLARTKGKLHWALAAYNAGEEATQSWVRRFSGVDPVLQIDLITFRETRNYVSMVLSNYFWYRKLYEADQGTPLKELLGSEGISELGTVTK